MLVRNLIAHLILTGLNHIASSPTWKRSIYTGLAIIFTFSEGAAKLTENKFLLSQVQRSWNLGLSVCISINITDSNFGTKIKIERLEDCEIVPFAIHKLICAYNKY